MKKQFLIALLITFAAHPLAAQPEQISDGGVAATAEDEFLSALLRASDEGAQVDNNPLEQMLEDFPDTATDDKGGVEQLSSVQRSAMAVAVKMIVFYGSCKKYLTQWFNSATSYLWGE